jgi:hypothetical protein
VIDDIKIRDASQDPEAREVIEQIITLMRIGVTPLLDKNQGCLPPLQACQITAASLFAGITLGHMIAIGVAKDQDKRRTGQLVLANFRSGVELGKREARQAMLEQLPEEGNA